MGDSVYVRRRTVAGGSSATSSAFGVRPFASPLRAARPKIHSGGLGGGVLQAKLGAIEGSTGKEGLPQALHLIESEIARQREATSKPLAVDRLKAAARDLEKAKGQLEGDVSLTVARLNRIIDSLNKNIDQNLVPDAQPSLGRQEEEKGAPRGLLASSSQGVLIPERALTMADLMRDPLYERAKVLGLLDDPQVHFWISPDYLEQRGEAGIPGNLMGVIVELQAKEAAEERHEEDFIEGNIEVFKGVKIVNPGQLTGGGRPATVREIDVLVVAVDDENLIPVSLLEAKKQGGKKPKGLKTDVDAKVRDLARVQEKGWRVLTEGGEDITDDLVLGGLVDGVTAGPGGEYDVSLNGAEVENLYHFINRYRYALSGFWY